MLADFIDVDSELIRDITEIRRIRKLEYKELSKITGVTSYVLMNITQNRITRIKTASYLRLVKFYKDNKYLLAKEKAEKPTTK